MKKFILSILIISCFGCESASQKTSCNYELVFDQALGYDVNEQDGTPAAISTHVAKRDSILLAKSKDSCFDQSLQKAARATLDNSDTKLDYHPEKTNKDEILFYIPYIDIQQGDMQFEVQIGDIYKEERVHAAVIPDKKFLIVPLLTSKKKKEPSITNTQMQIWHNEILKRLPLSRNGLQLILHDALDIREDIYDLDTWFGRLRTWNLLKQLKKEFECDGVIGLSSEKMDLNNQKDALSGFTFGADTTVILENGDETAITMVHEISHFYQVGDEYAGGQLNPKVNIPPYGMKGTDMLHPGTAASGINPFIRGGKNDEKQGSGTLITSSQIPYDSVEHKLIRHDMTSYMGKDGYAMQEYWTTGMIWKHLIQEWRITE